MKEAGTKLSQLKEEEGETKTKEERIRITKTATRKKINKKRKEILTIISVIFQFLTQSQGLWRIGMNLMIKRLYLSNQVNFRLSLVVLMDARICLSIGKKP